ncbi:hypothetical protein MNBD_UNCLBAC01-1357 [hydrothermal vent metagenome]|uniref:Cell division protein DivIC (FtsB), stabilizes FtsL against RasP cleavage n=1 Tax=hydrothermal vent metagenome TaxID=652676 RepID=A0A3B1DPU4_9ZZZZ
MIKKFFLFFVIIIGFLAIYLPSYTRVQDKKQKNLEYKQKIKQLKVKSVQLRKEKRLLEEDPVYLEKIAREKMGIIREGEIIYRITPMNKEE